MSQILLGANNRAQYINVMIRNTNVVGKILYKLYEMKFADK